MLLSASLFDLGPGFSHFKSNYMYFEKTQRSDTKNPWEKTGPKVSYSIEVKQTVQHFPHMCCALPRMVVFSPF